jgi:hypothetical protein
MVYGEYLISTHSWIDGDGTTANDKASCGARSQGRKIPNNKSQTTNRFQKDQLSNKYQITNLN